MQLAWLTAPDQSKNAIPCVTAKRKERRKAEEKTKIQSRTFSMGTKTVIIRVCNDA